MKQQTTVCSNWTISWWNSAWNWKMKESQHPLQVRSHDSSTFPCNIFSAVCLGAKKLVHLNVSQRHNKSVRVGHWNRSLLCRMHQSGSFIAQLKSYRRGRELFLCSLELIVTRREHMWSIHYPMPVFHAWNVKFVALTCLFCFYFIFLLLSIVTGSWELIE